METKCQLVSLQYSRGKTPGDEVKIEILGHGCDNCRRLEANARQAASMAGIDAEVVHVTDDVEIARRGVLRTPGLVFDGTIMSTGRVPSAGDIAEMLSRG
jgi:small redox-active disulfide protein 2